MKYAVVLLIMLVLIIGCDKLDPKITPYDEEYATSLVVTELGETVTAGLSVHLGTSFRGNPLDSSPVEPFAELHLAKLSPVGGYVWQTFINPSLTTIDNAVAVRVLPNGSYEVAGVGYHHETISDFNVLFFEIEVEATGEVGVHSETVVELRYVFEVRDVIPRANGGYAYLVYAENAGEIAGWYLALTTGDNEIELLKLLDFSYHTNIVGMAEGRNGEIAIGWNQAGEASSAESGFVVYLSDGTKLIDDSWVIAQYVTNAICATEDGYALAGRVETRIGVRQYTTVGNLVGSYSYNLEGSQEASNIMQASNGDFIVVGNDIYDPSLFKDTVVLRVSQEGERLWTKVIENDSNKHLHDLKETRDGDFVIVGGSYLSPGGDVYVLKISGDGEILWETEIGI